MLRHPVVRRGVAATDSPGEDLADRGGGQTARGVRSRAAPTGPPGSIGARLAGPARSGAWRAVRAPARRRRAPREGARKGGGEGKGVAGRVISGGQTARKQKNRPHNDKR